MQPPRRNSKRKRLVLGPKSFQFFGPAKSDDRTALVSGGLSRPAHLRDRRGDATEPRIEMRQNLQPGHTSTALTLNLYWRLIEKLSQFLLPPLPTKQVYIVK